MGLSGRVAIVTGAGGGLGRSHALLLARQGVRVMVNDVQGEAAEAVAEEIVAALRQAGAQAIDLVQLVGLAPRLIGLVRSAL